MLILVTTRVEKSYLLSSKCQRRARSQSQTLTLKCFLYNLECYFSFAPLPLWMEVLFPLLVRRFLFRCFFVVLFLRFWDYYFINIIDVRARKSLDSNSLHIINKFFPVPTFFIKRMQRYFANGTLLRKPPDQTTPTDRQLISRAYLNTRASCNTEIPTLLVSPKMLVKRK